RYPQSIYNGINDGPMLYNWHESDNFLKKIISEWEYKIYKNASYKKPDLILKLVIDTETAMERKPFEKRSNVQYKTEIIESIEVPAKKIAKIDATKPLDEVMNDVYNEVSELL